MPLHIPLSLFLILLEDVPYSGKRLRDDPLVMATTPRIWQVSELAMALRQLVEQAYDQVNVLGELADVRIHNQTGHCYFTLRDEQAQLPCLMWQTHLQRVAFIPKDGYQVQVTGRLTFYEPRGRLQLIALSMQLAGAGARQQAFEALKRKLAAEGLFDEARKRPLPRFPRRIGLVTSDSGAAIYDLLSILGRRFPLVEVLLCPVRVQGQTAAPAIARAIQRLNALSENQRPDVLIVGRGGGSADDLWAFNEEVVARAIFASQIPVISAVGHETDVSIADLVADRRAATPSMAAEIAVPDRRELENYIHRLCRSLQLHLQHGIRQRRQTLHALLYRYGMRHLPERLCNLHERVLTLQRHLEQHGKQLIARRRESLALLETRLAAFDPIRPLERGYVRVRHSEGLVTRSHQLQPGDKVTLEFYDGHRNAQITS